MHTQGPWGVRYAKNMTAIETPKGEMQVSLHGIYDGLKPLSVPLQEWEANARLIAAAPDLLAALQAIVDAKPAGDSYPGDGWKLAHEKFAAFARAAIAKATA